MKAVVVLMLIITTCYCLPVKRSASSSESSEERVVAQRPVQVLRKVGAKLNQAEPTQTLPVESNESTDSEDEDADDKSGTDETEEDNTSESESEEAFATSSPATEEPTLHPIIDTGRGDSLGYPGDYKKSIVYVDAKDFEKIPSSYKSYSSNNIDGLTVVSKKKSAYNGQNINDVEKEIKLYKALQVHDGLLEEEDTSTPEMGAALGDNEIAPIGNQDTEGANAGDSSSASVSQETDGADSSPSSEETTATPGAADSDSDSSQSTESQESDEHTTDTSVIIAK